MNKSVFLNWVFAEFDGSFSWRKGLTFLAGIVFFVACISYVFNFGRKLPNEYIVVISGVFAFYFLKQTLANLVKKKNGEPS